MPIFHGLLVVCESYIYNCDNNTVLRRFQCWHISFTPIDFKRILMANKYHLRDNKNIVLLLHTRYRPTSVVGGNNDVKSRLLNHRIIRKHEWPPVLQLVHWPLALCVWCGPLLLRGVVSTLCKLAVPGWRGGCRKKCDHVNCYKLHGGCLPAARKRINPLPTKLYFFF